MTTELQYLLHGARSLVKTSAMRKQAEGLVDLRNPLHTGAIGAGIGGLGGLAGSALSGGDPKKKSKLRATLLGALGGGGIGAAGSVIGSKMYPKELTTKDKVNGVVNLLFDMYESGEQQQ